MYSWMPWKTKKVSIEKAQICLVPIKEKIGILIVQLKWIFFQLKWVFFHRKCIIFKFRSLWEDCIQCILDFPTVHPNALNVPVVWEEDELVHHVLGRLVSKQLRVLVTCGNPSCQSETVGKNSTHLACQRGGYQRAPLPPRVQAHPPSQEVARYLWSPGTAHHWGQEVAMRTIGKYTVGCPKKSVFLNFEWWPVSAGSNHYSFNIHPCSMRKIMIWQVVNQ